MDKTMNLSAYLNKLIKGSRWAIILFSIWLFLGGLLFWYVVYAPNNDTNLSKMNRDIVSTYSQNLCVLEETKHETQLENDLIDRQKEYIKGILSLSSFSFSLFRAFLMVILIGVPFFILCPFVGQFYNYKKIRKMFEAEHTGQ